MDLRTLSSKTRRERKVMEFALPSAVEAKVRARYPALSTSDWLRVEHGLREWLIICLHRRRRDVGMPSRIVDEAWHELILCTAVYTQLCQSIYRSYLHHTPDSQMTTPLGGAVDKSVLAWDRSALAAIQGEATIWELDYELGIDRPLGVDFTRRQEVRTRARHAVGDSGSGSGWVSGCSGGSEGGGGASCGGGGGCGGGGS